MNTALKRSALAATLAVMLIHAGCSPSYEGSLMTRTRTSTTRKQYVQEKSERGTAGREYGVLRPSRKQTVVEKTVLEYDSICVFNYPRFARFGLAEISGLVAGGRAAGDNRVGNGLLGVYNTLGPRSTRDNAIFNGYMARIGMWEHRFPAIGKDWTIGSALFEAILNGTKDGQQLLGFFPVYLKKRIALTDSRPQLSLQPYAGVSLLSPFRYFNTGVSLHAGSIGGANMFAHAGLAIGGRANPDASEIDEVRVIPYVGLGLSMFDFFHNEKEMDTEWRYHEDPTRRTGLLQITLLRSSGSTPAGIVLGEGNDEITLFRDFDGFIGQFGIVSFPADKVLPHLTVGTSLINLLWLGNFEGAAGILPLRGAYEVWLSRALLFEPFLEVNYYPSQVLHLGARLNFGDIEGCNIGLQLGGMYGSTGQLTSNIFADWTQEVSGVYIGVSFSVFDYYSSPVITHFREKKDCRTPYGEY
ncbi:MAG: hypothetical protein HY962_14160 [Ignavibacteriae bacterium]|nr:hypothetical protein [Ignavibacteriota bacterium]